MISMKKVEAIFITSRLDTVRELLSQRCGLDIAMSRANEPPDRGQAVLLPELPLVRLEAFVSERTSDAYGPGDSTSVAQCARD